MTEKDIIATTYYDTMDIYRKTDIKDPVTKINKQDYVKIQTALKCALSKKKLSILKIIDNKNDSIYESRIFLDPGVQVLKGDKMELTIGVNGEIRIFYAGEPMVYISHREVPVFRPMKASFPWGQAGRIAVPT